MEQAKAALWAILKPCPFCGGHGSVTYDSGNEVWNQSWEAGCKKCGIGFHEYGSNSWATNKKEDDAAKAKAIEQWNRRV